MTDTPIHEMTPQQATEHLASLQRAYDARTAPPTDKPATASEAKARLDHLARNQEWGAKLLAGDQEASRQAHELAEQAAGGADALVRVLAGATEPTALIETTTESELTTRETASAVAHLRERGFSDKAIREIFSGEKMTPEQVAIATDRKSRALRDPVFVKAYLDADPVAVDAMSLWNAVISLGADA